MIQEVVLLNEDGIPVFYYNFIQHEALDDYQLVASFLDQISSFSKVSLKEELSKIEYQGVLFLFYKQKKSNICLIFKTDNPGDRFFIYIKKTLDLIAKSILDAFLSEYSEELKNFSGEVSQFKPFSKKIEEILSNK